MQYFFKDTSLESVASVVLTDPDCHDAATIMAEDLSKISPPGWALTEKEYERRCSNCYGLTVWFLEEAGSGSNLLRTDDLAQPRALRIGDQLAYGEIVEKIRVGYNDSVIILLNRSGWVELAPRLPIALFGNKDFCLPPYLNKSDVLATGCRIAKSSTGFETKRGWAEIYLDRNCCISVPSCIPLAIA